MPRLWLCIHLPGLSLELFERGRGDAEAFAVVEASRILIANATAYDGGVRPGMGLAAAQALAPELRLRDRARQAEARALRQLAAWAFQFTERVSLQPPVSVLLEIGASLRYFGGLEALRERVAQGVAGLGYRAVLGVAPTPSAALLLARAAAETPVTQTDRLRESLSPLSIAVLDLDERQLTALDGLGIATLGECLALPRGGLTRRLGPDLLRQLDRALGMLAEPRRSWRAPPRFRGSQELPAEVESTEHLVFAINRLLRELCGYLRGIGAGVQRLHVTLEHLSRPATSVYVGLLAPSRDPEHLLELTRQRLEHLALPAPVIGLALASRDIHTLAAENYALLDDERSERTGWSALVERLAARLGERAIHGLKVCAEHRPERAWRYAPPGQASDAEPVVERPLWLLTEPQALTIDGGQPLWNGSLLLLQGPERIETGWWDGHDVARDYYVAENAAGERVWIYRERRGEHSWYLHGIFA